jgi:hypothetical protein
MDRSAIPSQCPVRIPNRECVWGHNRRLRFDFGQGASGNILNSCGIELRIIACQAFFRATFIVAKAIAGLSRPVRPDHQELNPLETTLPDTA